MRQFLALSLAAALLALLLVTTAIGAGPSNQFAVGSAKTGADAFVGLEHLSFSAHNVKFPPSPCAASGSAVYDSPTLHIKIDVQELVIDPGSATAYFAGPVVFPSDPLFQGTWGQFDVLDGDQLSTVGDVTPDAFQFDGLFPPSPCRAPGAVSGPVTSGNIVIKATGPLLLP
jgi:hypothetical protein